jgi:DNA-binding beta-propeller fold protein YncE
MKNWVGPLILSVLLLTPASRAATTAPLELVQTIPMPGVRGRIDHMSIDLEGRRLFVSALENNTVEVIDLAAGKDVHQIPDLREPQGVLYVPESKKLFVGNGGDGTCRIFDARNYRLLSTVHFGSDADDIRYDQAAGLVYVGYGEGGLGILNALTGKELGRIGLPAHPEAFEVENAGARIYINIPDKQEIAVADWARRSMVARWPMVRFRANFPMAYDPARHRLFVVCRRPAEFLALDPQSGRILARLPVVGDADDLYYDPLRKRLYVSGGQGAISVIEQVDANRYRTLATIPTAPGARTSIFVPQLNRFYVAVPPSGGHGAEIRAYAVAP